MFIYDYVQKYDYTFDERPFNEVDNLVFSTLVYLNYEGIVSNNKKDKVTIANMAKKYIKKNSKKSMGEAIAVKNAIKLLINIENSKRFKNVLVYNYIYKGNEIGQFSAMTFEFNNTLFIAYEGTDDLISGWEEDFKMCYMYPVDAHVKAIKYLNSYTFDNKKIIVGGHSKGGNLALVAGMGSNMLIKHKLINIYSNDGQGLRLTELNSRRYKKIKNKLIHFMPHNAIVGLLFRHDTDIVIKSSALTLFSHAPGTWKIKDDMFIRSELTKTSMIFDKGMSEWLDKYDYEKRKRFIDNVFGILKDNGIDTLSKIRKNPSNIIKLIKSSNNLTDETREMGNDLIKIFNKINKESK